MSSLTGRVFGYYHILDRIGQGGMGTVYRALDRKADREVAIKFISPAIAQQEVFLQRFRREVKAVARLHHPNIVPVLDYGEQRGYAYLVMPLLDVSTLLDLLQQGPVSLELGARVMDQIAGALAHAHRHGIIHRDVKPSNILLDREQNALLSDFGLARLHDSAASLTGAGLIGTPAYMAPEQATGGTVDARADQYALGVVLFYLATGSLPFTANTPLEYLLKHVNEPFPAARARNPRVPEPVERVILRATAKKPEHRFGSVTEMNHALQTALAYLRDPMRHDAPTIELPGALAPALTVSPGASALERTTPLGATPLERTVPLGTTAPVRTASPRTRRSPLRLAAAVAAGVLLILAAPVFANGLLDLLGRASSPAEGSVAGAGLIRLTQQAGTIVAMSTELAESHSDPAAIQTAISLTLTAAAPAEAGDPSSTDPASIPAALAATQPTPTTALSGGQSLAGATPTPGGSPLPSTTGSAQNTPLPGAPTATRSATPTNTNQPPGPTATETTAPVPVPTSTQTPPPTSTQTPPPTNTPVPPTEDPCSALDLGGFQMNGKTASWDLSNGSATSVTITHIVLDWPAANGGLDRIRFASSSIWNGSDDSPPSDISSFNGNHSLGNGSKALKFEFTEQAQSGGYDLQVELGPGCQVSAGG